MIKYNLVFMTAILILWISCKGKPESSSDTISWQEGFFDIHHIKTNRADATFMIFPDGATLLFDAGSIVENPNHFPSIYPSDTLMPGAWIAHYIKSVLGNKSDLKIDYFVLSHFHTDHFGQLVESTPKASNGAYRLTGVTEVGDIISIRKIIDRGYPEYNFPVELRSFYDSIRPRPAFENYLNFIQYHQDHSDLSAETIICGTSDQIVSSLDNFSVKAIKVNDLIWDLKEDSVYKFDFDPYAAYDSINQNFNENPFSIALLFSYGDFDYYTGGDVTGITNGINAFDFESELSSIGQVEAMTLNHHGAPDATNELFLTTLDPKVIIHQSLHHHHFHEKTLKTINRTSADAFALHNCDSVYHRLSGLMRKNYRSRNGHILIRVYPKGNFKIFIIKYINSELNIDQEFGPYNSY